ncbi:hypothetical protein [Asanoa sp. NPDC050611]|uniref:hypothetical protein n=1 Tax=Asanoa sp. NPDC050611 TaxID=3157098 RepID=UPI00340EF9BC
MKERTVSFYEVVDVIEGDQKRVAHRDWNGVLARLGRAKFRERIFEGDTTLLGTVHTLQGEDHLLLHKVKAQEEWLSTIDMSTGEWSEMELAATTGYLDSSVVAFLPFGNVIGLMQGSVGAPSHKALERWLNGLNLFATPVAVRPVVSKAEIDQLLMADGAVLVELRLGTHGADALIQKGGALSWGIRALRQEYGDIRINLAVSVPRGRGRERVRARLLDEIRYIADVVPGSADAARAKLSYLAPGGGYTRLVELVEHHITAKRRVAAVNEKGQSVKILSAIQVIMDVSASHEAELRRAVDLRD